MIKAHFFKDAKTGALNLRVKGHSGAANRGEDLVCAAASILTMTAAQAVFDLYAEGRTEGKPLIKLASGRARIAITPKPDAAAEALHALFIVQKGFAVLAGNEPDFVKLRPFVIKDDTAGKA